MVANLTLGRLAALFSFMDLLRNMRRVTFILLLAVLPILMLTSLLRWQTAVAGGGQFTVNSTEDVNDANPGDGFCDSDAAVPDEQCTLRAAISEANALAGVSMISLPAGIYTLNITGILEDGNATGDLDITSNLHLVGAGSDETIIQAGETISDSVDRVFHILQAPTAVSFAHLTIQHGLIANSGTVIGQTDDGAGLFVLGNPDTAVSLTNVKVTHNRNLDLREDGAGIANLGGGTVFIRDSEISHNHTRLEPGSSGAGLFSVFGSHMIIHNSVISGNVAGGKGGGIYTNLDGSEIHITDSLIANNRAEDIGGGIQSGSKVFITNTTISGNTTAVTGGGISNDSVNSELVLNFVTISNNQADRDNLGNGDGGGLHLISGTITMTNSIVAGNWRGSSTPDDCSVDKPIWATYSLVQVMTNCSLTGTQIITGTNPHLQPLADNGGRTLTHALAESSPAIDYVPEGDNGCGVVFFTDQRGLSRPYGAGCDIGAYEWPLLRFIYLPIVVTD